MSICQTILIAFLHAFSDINHLIVFFLIYLQCYCLIFQLCFLRLTAYGYLLYGLLSQACFLLVKDAWASVFGQSIYIGGTC